jgi:predicted small integral membrane protein
MIIILVVALHIVTFIGCVAQTRLQRIPAAAWRFNAGVAVVLIGFPLLALFVSSDFTWTEWLSGWMAPAGLAAASLMRVRMLAMLQAT